jgi:hypothetical protein
VGSEEKNKDLYSQATLLTVITPEQFPFSPWAIIQWLTCAHKPRSVSSMQIPKNRTVAYFRVLFQVRTHVEKLRKVTKQRLTQENWFQSRKLSMYPLYAKQETY